MSVFAHFPPASPLLAKANKQNSYFFPCWELPHLNHAIPVRFMLNHAILQHLLSILFLPNLMLMTQQPLFKKKKKASQVFLKFSQSWASLCQTICIDLKMTRPIISPVVGTWINLANQYSYPWGQWLVPSEQSFIRNKQFIRIDRDSERDCLFLPFWKPGHKRQCHLRDAKDHIFHNVEWICLRVISNEEKEFLETKK